MNDRDPNHNGNKKHKTPEEIEAEIDQTRHAISEDISALGEKLSPENLKEGAKGVIREAKEEAKDMLREAKEAAVDSLRTAKDSAMESVTETMSEIGDQARRAGSATAGFVSANAVPLALIGIGVGWLTLTMRRQRTLRQARYERGYDYDDVSYGAEPYYASSTTHLGEAYRDTVPGKNRVESHRVRDGVRSVREGGRRLVGTAREKVGELAERAADGVGTVRERAREGVNELGHRATELGHRATELGHDAREQLRRAEMGARDLAYDNPLAVGAVAIAAGIGVGMLLPATRRENELMGPTRTRLMNEARDTAQRLGTAAKEAAQEVKTALTDASV